GRGVGGKGRGGGVVVDPAGEAVGSYLRRQHTRAGGEVEAEEVVGQELGQESDHVDAGLRDVDDAGAQHAGRVDVAAPPAARLRSTEVAGPHDRAGRLVERVHRVLQRRHVDEAVVDERFPVDVAVEGR